MWSAACGTGRDWVSDLLSPKFQAVDDLRSVQRSGPIYEGCVSVRRGGSPETERGFDDQREDVGLDFGSARVCNLNQREPTET